MAEPLAAADMDQAAQRREVPMLSDISSLWPPEVLPAAEFEDTEMKSSPAGDLMFCEQI